MVDAARRDSGQRFRPRLVWGAQSFIVLFSIWLVFEGAQAWPVGVLAAITGGVVAGWLADEPPRKWNPLRLFEFCAFFLIESVRGGMDVAWRTLHPKMPVRPNFFRHRMVLPKGQPSTLLISTISLLPGTLSAELDRDENVLVVHSLTGGGARSVERLEQRIARLFSLTGAAGEHEP